MIRTLFLFAVVGILGAASTGMGCAGTALYNVTFTNFLTNDNFGDSIPEGGLVFSPLAGVSHSNRISFLTVRGFATQTVEEIAETGNNEPFLTRARRLRRQGQPIFTVRGADGPTMPGGKTTLQLRVTCDNPFITVLGMIAPSPDWIVQINNENLVDPMTGKFIETESDNLIAYDGGVDDGREFTPPMDASLDLPTEPRKNIAPLVEDETDRFDGRIVGRYVIKKVS